MEWNGGFLGFVGGVLRWGRAGLEAGDGAVVCCKIFGGLEMRLGMCAGRMQMAGGNDLAKAVRGSNFGF